MGKKLRLFLTV